MAQIDRKLQLPDPLKDIKTFTELIEAVRKYQTDFNEALLRFTRRIVDVLNGGIKITDNFDAQILTITTAGADTEVVVAHTLKRIPQGYIVLSVDKAGVIYTSGTAWTASNIYIKCNVATVSAKLLIL